jgi:spore coat protein H
MKMRVGLISLVLLLAAIAVGTAKDKAKSDSPKVKAPKPPVGEALFGTNAPIRVFNVEVSSNELAGLKKEARSYARGTIKEGTNVLRDVGIHLKGNGSFQGLDAKPSFVTKFDRYVPDQKYFGLNKIMLNNSAQDGTLLAEMMAGWLFRDANVPSPRITHARVTFNGRDLGMYFVAEAENKDFLKHWFKNHEGSLYEAYLADIDSQMDQDNGDDTSQADVKQFAAVTKMTNIVERWNKLPTVLDVDRYVSHLVCELFVAHTDGYAMNKNNYRIYRNTDTGRFTFIAHGMDWGYANTGVGMRPPMNALVTKAVLESPQGWALFKQRRMELFTNVFQLSVFTNRVNWAVARLVSQARNANETNQFRGWGNEMNNRLIARWGNISNQLYAPEPQPIAFDANGIAKLKGWEKKMQSGTPVQEATKLESKNVLRISSTNAPCIASWRTAVLLREGKYSFEGDVRGTGIVPQQNDENIGAGLRKSGEIKRPNKVVGDAGWTHIQYDIEVPPGTEQEVVLVCELRASKGEAWFDADSLRLTKKK